MTLSPQSKTTFVEMLPTSTPRYVLFIFVSYPQKLLTLSQGQPSLHVGQVTGLNSLSSYRLQPWTVSAERLSLACSQRAVSVLCLHISPTLSYAQPNQAHALQQHSPDILWTSLHTFLSCASYRSYRG